MDPSDNVVIKGLDSQQLLLAGCRCLNLSKSLNVHLFFTAILTLTSPPNINVPAIGCLNKDSFDSLVLHLNNKYTVGSEELNEG